MITKGEKINDLCLWISFVVDLISKYANVPKMVRIRGSFSFLKILSNTYFKGGIFQREPFKACYFYPYKSIFVIIKKEGDCLPIRFQSLLLF